MSKCAHCGQDVKPIMTIEEYESRAIPRLKEIDRIWEVIQRHGLTDSSAEYQRYWSLMSDQAADEEAAGL